MAAAGQLAAAWENNRVIRHRLMKQKFFLQWPSTSAPAETQEEEIEPAHPVCTQALELNVDVLTVMVDELDGQFISIDDLKPEAEVFVSVSTRVEGVRKELRCAYYSCPCVYDPSPMHVFHPQNACR